MRQIAFEKKVKEQKREKRNKIIIWSIVGVAILAIVVSIIFVITGKKSNDSNPTSSANQMVPANLTSDNGLTIKAPNPTNTYQGDKVTLDTWIDPLCPGCGQVERTAGSTIVDMLNSGEINLVVHPMNLLDRASTDYYSTRASNALVTVIENDPDHAATFMSKIYENQPSEGSSYQSVPDSTLAQWAQAVGVPQNVTDKFKDYSYSNWISQQANDTVKNDPKFSTPKFVAKYNGVSGEKDKDISFSSLDIVGALKDGINSVKS